MELRTQTSIYKVSALLTKDGMKFQIKKIKKFGTSVVEEGATYTGDSLQIRAGKLYLLENEKLIISTSSIVEILE